MHLLMAKLVMRYKQPILYPVLSFQASLEFALPVTLMKETLEKAQLNVIG